MSLYSKGHRGFTLTELLVSIGIVSVMLTVIVLNQSAYTDSVALSNLADEISSTISQAQAYGIGVREFSPSSSEFSASFGLTFSLLASGSDKAYLSFADRDSDGPSVPTHPNKIYDGDWSCPVGGASECLEKVTITRGNFIEDICIIRVNSTEQCNVAKRVDISFARPSTEAQIKFFNSGGNPVGASNDKGARIQLQSPRGATRLVTIYATGQISVQ